MKSSNKTQIRKNLVEKQLIVIRDFDAPIAEVWNAWTKSELLDAWWAPKPWKTHTKTLDFREGGEWLYAMVGPDGTKHWSKVDYKTIVPHEKFAGYNSFCDEAGNVDTLLPGMFWDVEFKQSVNGCTVHVLLTFDSEEDLKKIVEMGFEQGFTAAHGNLDELLAVNNHSI